MKILRFTSSTPFHAFVRLPGKVGPYRHALHPVCLVPGYADLSRLPLNKPTCVLCKTQPLSSRERRENWNVGAEVLPYSVSLRIPISNLQEPAETPTVFSLVVGVSGSAKFSGAYASDVFCRPSVGNIKPKLGIVETERNVGTMTDINAL